MGRPPKYTDPELMQSIIDTYFEVCDVEKRAYTLPGIALALGFADKSSVSKYGAKPKFRHVVKRAMLKIEEQILDKMSKNQAIAAGIFRLCNHYGYVNVQRQEVTGSGGKPLTLQVVSYQGAVAQLPESPKQITESKE